MAKAWSGAEDSDEIIESNFTEVDINSQVVGTRKRISNKRFSPELIHTTKLKKKIVLNKQEKEVVLPIDLPQPPLILLADSFPIDTPKKSKVNETLTTSTPNIVCNATLKPSTLSQHQLISSTYINIIYDIMYLIIYNLIFIFRFN